MKNIINNVEREEKKVTLYNKLNALGNKIPLNGFIEGQFSSYEPKKDYYIYDKEIINSIKRKIIEPYESNPIVGDIINKKSTILEIIRPIESKADKVRREYEQIRFIKRFDPEKKIFGENENLIATELEDILDIKKAYEKGFIASKGLQEIADKVYGYNIEKRFGSFRPLVFNSRNALPIALATVYFAETDPNFLFQPDENYHIIGDLTIGLLGELIGAMASIISSLPFVHEGADKIKEETERLRKQAQFLDETITDLYK